MKRLAFLVLVALLSMGLLTGCGSSSGQTHELEVIMGPDGVWRFEPDVIEVNKGDTVKLTLVNRDPTTEHTFVINALNVKSKTVYPNETDELTFQAKTAGEYEIVCDIIGHKDAGMVGKLVVK